jgi:hypothetical protein
MHFLSESDHSMITEILTWHPVASPPDSDTTVLLFDPAASEPV